MKLITPNIKTAITVNGEKRDGWDSITIARLNPSVFEGSGKKGYDWEAIGLTLYRCFGKRSSRPRYVECSEVIRVFDGLPGDFTMKVKERDCTLTDRLNKNDEIITLLKTIIGTLVEIRDAITKPAVAERKEAADAII